MLKLLISGMIIFAVGLGGSESSWSAPIPAAPKRGDVLRKGGFLSRKAPSAKTEVKKRTVTRRPRVASKAVKKTPNPGKRPRQVWIPGAIRQENEGSVSFGRSQITDDTAIYQEVSEIRTPPAKSLSAEKEVERLSRIQGRYRERLRPLGQTGAVRRKTARARN